MEPLCHSRHGLTWMNCDVACGCGTCDSAIMYDRESPTAPLASRPSPLQFNPLRCTPSPRSCTECPICPTPCPTLPSGREPRPARGRPRCSCKLRVRSGQRQRRPSSCLRCMAPSSTSSAWPGSVSLCHALAVVPLDAVSAPGLTANVPGDPAAPNLGKGASSLTSVLSMITGLMISFVFLLFHGVTPARSLAR